VGSVTGTEGGTGASAAGAATSSRCFSLAFLVVFLRAAFFLSAMVLSSKYTLYLHPLIGKRD
jgi:hypothetical protein